MKTQRKINWILLGAVLIGASIIGSGCASKKNLWGDPETGLILKYNLPDQEKVSYQKTTNFNQKMEINGQNIEVKADQDFFYSMLLNEKNQDEYGFEVTLDSATYTIASPRGEIIPDLSGIVGKSFNMAMSTSGKEKDLEEAKSIKFSMEGEEQSIATSFMGLFPDLPDHPVKIGDSWSSVDTIVEESSKGNMLLIFNYYNTLMALETVEGFECVKVDSKVTGSMTGEGAEKEVLFDWSGDIEGSGTWYFAYKKGLIVKDIGNGTGEGALIISSKDMSIPMSREFYVENSLLKQ